MSDLSVDVQNSSFDIIIEDGDIKFDHTLQTYILCNIFTRLKKRFGFTKLENNWIAFENENFKGNLSIGGRLIAIEFPSIEDEIRNALQDIEIEDLSVTYNKESEILVNLKIQKNVFNINLSELQ